MLLELPFLTPHRISARRRPTIHQISNLAVRFGFAGHGSTSYRSCSCQRNTRASILHSTAMDHGRAPWAATTLPRVVWSNSPRDLGRRVFFCRDFLSMMKKMTSSGVLSFFAGIYGLGSSISSILKCPAWCWKKCRTCSSTASESRMLKICARNVSTSLRSG